MQFGIVHQLATPRLRPSRKWHPDRKLEKSWSLVERPAVRGASKAPGKKRKASDLAPGLKEQEELNAAKVTRELLEMYKVGTVVEVKSLHNPFDPTHLSPPIGPHPFEPTHLTPPI